MPPASNTPHLNSFFSSAFKSLKAHGKPIAITYTLLAVPVLILILTGKDPGILTAIQQPDNSSTHKIAEWVSEFGEFQYSTLLVAALFGVIAWMRKGLARVRFREIAVGILIAGLLGGVLVNVFRPTFGRARPHQNEDGRFTWFRMNSRYQGFPSGHTSSTTASMTALAILCPPAAAPAAATSLAVGWSRMQRNKHYLSDVLGGLMLGSFCGLWTSLTMREMRSRQQISNPPPEDPQPDSPTLDRKS